MRSGNGRHRRPKQIPALVVTAGVAGSALALPLLAATNASAADAGTWDTVAECESGGSWSANYGGGAYGGLQFTQEQWNEAGGLDYATRPDLASRSQQIAVAEQVLASQGPQAWPLCASSAGLTRQGPSAAVDPGRVETPAPVAPTPSRPDSSVPKSGSTPATDFGVPTPTGPAPTLPGPSGTPSFTLPDVPQGPNTGLPVMPDPDPTLPTGPSNQPPVAPTTPGGTTAPVVPSDPAKDPNPADPSTTPSAPTGTPTDSATDGGGKHRGPAADEALGVVPNTAPEPVYTVKAGDSLTAIADAKGLKGGWTKLYEANEQVIGGDADLIKPGQNLDLTK